jgi:hypothetical protein
MDIEDLDSLLSGTIACHRVIYALTGFVIRARTHDEPSWIILRL